MATKFLTSLDLSKNELQNAVIQNLAVAPSTNLAEGLIYYDTALDVLRVYANGAWASLSTGSGTVTAVTGTGAISSTGGTTPAISIADASTTVKGAVQLSDSTSTTSSILAATPTAVKAAYDAAASKVASVAAGSARISIGGTATAPTVDVAAASTTVAGIVQLSDSTSTTSSILAATPTAVKAAYDLANGKASASDVHYIGTTSVALNRSSANLDLTGISSVTLPGSTSGTAQVIATAVAGTGTVITLPATTGTVALTANKLSAFAATTSAELRGVISDETGTGALVFANTPTLVTPDIGAATGTSLVLSGDLTVNGTTTTLNSTTVTVDDKNIELGSVAVPTNVTADGGGITLKGTTDKTINWVNATTAWTLSEHADLASGKVYKINNTEVLSGTTLGSGVTGSSLTSVGTIATGVWNGTAIALANGGTGATSASAARDALAESGFGLARKKSGSATWTAGEAKAITHSLGTKDVTVALYDSSDALVFTDVATTSTSVVTVTISLAGTYRYVIIG